MRRTLKVLLVFGTVSFLTATSCRKKDPPKTLPVVSTVEPSAITPNTAMTGGNISSNGNAAITISGVCYSKTNNLPTVSNDTTINTVAGGSFVSTLKNLSSGSTYYVRAYATNSVGTAYGEMKTFTTGNAAPEARNITLAGGMAVGDLVKARFTYFDSENDAAADTIYQWYIANDSIGATVTAIVGAADSAYRLLEADKNRFIRVSITVKAAAGTANGAEIKSAWIGPIGAAPTTLTFSYNGSTVTYGIIKSNTTGRFWLDRNLGAVQAATSFNDYKGYGDLFQWGRAADGHQLINRTGNSSSSQSIPISATSSSISASISPGNAFILSSGGRPYDWVSPQRNELWQGSNGLNNPCPHGWRVPTITEWTLEFSSNSVTFDAGFSALKTTITGYRDFTSGSIATAGSIGYSGFYWTSSIEEYEPGKFLSSVFSINDNGSSSRSNDWRASGLAVRCIKD